MNVASEVAGDGARTGVPAPHKILIVRLGAMGDIIHALPAAMMLRTSFPHARLGWVIERRWRGLLGPTSLVDEIHEVDTRRWRKGIWESRDEIVSAFRELRVERYDVAVDFQGAMKSSVIMLASGAPKRYGFADPREKPASLFYTHPVITRARHVVEQNFELAAEVVRREHGSSAAKAAEIWASLTARPKPCPYENGEPTTEDFEEKITGLQLGQCFAILNPGAGWGAKQWPVDRYAEVARELGKQGTRSLINYGPGEESLAREVESNSDGHAVAASFTISQLIAVTRRASLFVGGDTGPMHLAVLLNVPVVAIFGPTDPARNGPYGTINIVLRDPASITSHKRNRSPEAGLLNITADQVLKASCELLSKKAEGVRA